MVFILFFIVLFDLKADFNAGNLTLSAGSEIELNTSSTSSNPPININGCINLPPTSVLVTTTMDYIVTNKGKIPFAKATCVNGQLFADVTVLDSTCDIKPSVGNKFEGGSLYLEVFNLGVITDCTSDGVSVGFNSVLAFLPLALLAFFNS